MIDTDDIFARERGGEKTKELIGSSYLSSEQTTARFDQTTFGAKSSVSQMASVGRKWEVFERFLERSQ